MAKSYVYEFTRTSVRFVKEHCSMVVDSEELAAYAKRHNLDLRREEDRYLATTWYIEENEDAFRTESTEMGDTYTNDYDDSTISEIYIHSREPIRRTTQKYSEYPKKTKHFCAK